MSLCHIDNSGFLYCLRVLISLFLRFNSAVAFFTQKLLVGIDIIEYWFEFNISYMKFLDICFKEYIFLSFTYFTSTFLDSCI